MKHALTFKHELIKKEFTKMVLASRDIRQTIGMCELMEAKVKELEDPLYFPLAIAAIICYAKPFTHSRNSTILNGTYSKFNTKAKVNLHEKILSMRNKAIAHSDADSFPISIYKEDADCCTKFEYSIQYFALGIENFLILKEMCNDILEKIEKRIDKLFSKINFFENSNFLENLSIKELKELLNT